MASNPPVLPETGHVGLNVTDLERSLEFYESVFGFRTQHRSFAPGRRFAFLASGDKLVLTLWEQGEGRFDAALPGLHHLSFQVPSMAGVEAIQRRVEATGARLIYPDIVPHAEGAASGGVFFEDPDGTRLEVFAATGAERHEAPSDGPSCGFF